MSSSGPNHSSKLSWSFLPPLLPSSSSTTNAVEPDLSDDPVDELVLSISRWVERLSYWSPAWKRRYNTWTSRTDFGSGQILTASILSYFIPTPWVDTTKPRKQTSPLQNTYTRARHDRKAMQSLLSNPPTQAKLYKYAPTSPLHRGLRCLRDLRLEISGSREGKRRVWDDEMNRSTVQVAMVLPHAEKLSRIDSVEGRVAKLRIWWIEDGHAAVAQHGLDV